MMLIYQNENGVNKTFQWLQKDAKTPQTMNSSMTITWRLKSLNTPTTLIAIACTVTDFNNAKFYGTLTAALTANIDDYEAQIEMAIGSTLLRYTEPFLVRVAKNDAVAG